MTICSGSRIHAVWINVKVFSFQDMIVLAGVQNNFHIRGVRA